MKKTSKTIVFFGSGPVAAQSLSLLIEDFIIEAVITKPKPTHHKGDTPVLELAEKMGLRIFTPENKKELSKLFESKPVNSKLGVVIDYGIIIAQDVIDYFPLGIINSHFSLLPQWRGADPITFSILSGQQQTGISLMLIAAGLDEGPLLAQSAYDIEPATTTPQLTNDLIELSHQSLVQILPLYMEGKIYPAPQEQVSIAESKIPTYSRKLTKDDGLIDWGKPAEVIEREIRAFYEWPKSRTVLFGKDIIVTQAHSVSSQAPEAKPGDAEITEDAGGILVATGNGSLCIDKLKPAGKKEMTAAAFINGYLRMVK